MVITKMQLAFQESLVHCMYYFLTKHLLDEKFGRDLSILMMSFLKEDPKPWILPIVPQPSPWDPLICVDADDGIALPLFAP